MQIKPSNHHNHKSLMEVDMDYWEDPYLASRELISKLADFHLSLKLISLTELCVDHQRIKDFDALVNDWKFMRKGLVF